MGSTQWTSAGLGRKQRCPTRRELSTCTTCGGLKLTFAFRPVCSTAECLVFSIRGHRVPFGYICRALLIPVGVSVSADIFASSSEDLGRTTLLEMEIETGGHAPIRQMPRRMSPKQREEIAGQVEKLFCQGVTEPSSPWSSPIVLAKKKDGTTRMCIDFRTLSAVTLRDAFLRPRVDDTLDALGGAKFFLTLDLSSGYHQIPIAAKDREKTAISTIDGHYQCTSMSFWRMQRTKFVPALDDADACMQDCSGRCALFTWMTSSCSGGHLTNTRGASTPFWTNFVRQDSRMTTSQLPGL